MARDAGERVEAGPRARQGRDLAPTTDLRAVMKGVLKHQFVLAEKVLGESVFPDSAAVKSMQGLVG